MRSLYDGAIIDTLTGAVTSRDGARMVWKVIQKGSGETTTSLPQMRSCLMPTHLRRTLRPTSSACALGRKIQR